MKRRVLKECVRIAIKNNNPLNHPEYHNYKHFSFMIQNNKIVEWGMNRKGDALLYLGYPKYSKIHSEIDMYYKGSGIMGRGSFEVVNIRLSKGNEFKNSSPCSCCYAFLKKLGCKRIWFSISMGEFGVV